MADPAAAADEARLRYVADGEAGLRRQRKGRGFTYLDPQGRTVRDPRVRERVEALAIPPAWTDVWICRSPHGHVQATGRDDAGRKQYIYHPRWRETRDRAKFEHLIAFGEVLPRVRRRARRDLKRPGLERRKVTAAVIRLMDETLVRIGNTAYARSNGSYGLTTLRDRHVAIHGDAIDLRFDGKGGETHDLSLRDAALARVVKDCQDIPGYELFQFVDDADERHTLDSADVNDYLRDVTGREVTAKDFRTWGGTVLAASCLHAHGDGADARERKRRLLEAVTTAADALGNTPAVCRSSYLHPRVLDSYEAGEFLPAYDAALASARRHRPGELRLHEAATLSFLRAGASQQGGPSARSTNGTSESTSSSDVAPSAHEP